MVCTLGAGTNVMIIFVFDLWNKQVITGSQQQNAKYISQNEQNMGENL